MLVCKLCGCVVDHQIDFGLYNIIPCNICKDRIVVCRKCADGRNVLCVCCKRDSRIKEVLGEV